MQKTLAVPSAAPMPARVSETPVALVHVGSAGAFLLGFSTEQPGWFQPALLLQSALTQRSIRTYRENLCPAFRAAPTQLPVHILNFAIFLTLQSGKERVFK